MSTKHILIVEDDRDILDALTDLLSSEGYRISSAENGKAALEFLEGNEDLPGLILLDLMMPVMDGFQFNARQMQNEKIRNIPCVVMSADGHAALKLTRIKADQFLRKPIDLETVLETVAKFF